MNAIALTNFNLFFNSFTNDRECCLQSHHLRSVDFDNDINIAIHWYKRRNIISVDLHVADMIIMYGACPFRIKFTQIDRND